MAVGINIVSDFDTKGISKAIAEFSKLESASDKAQFALKKAALPAAAALAAIGAAAAFSVKAAIEDQAEQAKLAQVLNQVTGATKAQVTQVEQQIKSLTKISTFTDSDLRPALANLVQGTKDVTESQKLLALAMDISVATGTPLINVTDALAKAENGNLMALKKLTPAVTENIKEGASLDQIYQQLTATFGGAALDATQTTAGQFALLKNSVGELKESFGATLLPVVNLLIPVLQNLVVIVENNQAIFGVFAAVVSVFSGAILVANGFLKLNAAYQALVKMETIKTMLATQTATAIQTGFATATGLAVKGLGFLAAALMAQTAFNTFSGKAREADENLKKLIITTSNFGKQGGTTTEDIVKDFNNMAVHIASQVDFMGALMGKRLGKEFTLLADGAQIDLEHLDQAFSDVAAKSPEYAQKIVDALRAQAAATPTNLRAYTDLTDAANRYQKQLDLTTSSQNALNGAVSGLSFSKSSAGMRSASAHSLEFTARMKGAANMQDFFNKNTSAGGKTVETAAQKLTKYIDALQGVTSAQRSTRDASKAVTDSNTKLSQAITATAKAQANYNKVTQGFALDSKEVVKQTREVANAQRNLIRANISAADSVQAVKDAEEALQKLRQKVDVFDLESGEINIQKAKFDVEEADYAVLAAEKELADLRKDPEATPQAIRQAEIKLAESKFGVRDAIKAVKDAEKELVKLRTDTPTLKEIEVAERAVADAKRAAEDAAIAQADAQRNVNETQQELNELVNGATIGSDAYTEALKELRDAEEAEKDAAEARVTAYERLADATRDLAKAEKERRDASEGVSAADRAAADAAAVVVVPDFSTGGGGFDFGFGLVTPEDLNNINVPSLEELLGGGIGIFANGGIVTKAMLGLVGEAGAEAIIPLDRMGSMGSTYNIQVTAGMGADGKDIGTQIVNALKRYERTNGALPLTVA